MNDSRYFLPVGYQERLEPFYFDDSGDPADVWQPDVYSVAGTLADRLHATAIVDVGCGRATKLLRLANVAPITGIDYADNIRSCIQDYPEHCWIECDLEQTPTWTSAIPDGAIVICSDVIEHLIDPTNLLQGLFAALNRIHAVVLSTPDRDATHGPNHLGPPPHVTHVREWSHGELAKLLRSHEAEVWVAGLTRSCSSRLELATSLFVLRKTSGSVHQPEGAAVSTDSWGDWSGPADRRLVSPAHGSIEEHLAEAQRQGATRIEVTDLQLLDAIAGRAPATEPVTLQLPALRSTSIDSDGGSRPATAAMNLVAVPADLGPYEAQERIHANIAVAVTGADASSSWWPLQSTIGLRRRLSESLAELSTALRSIESLKQWIDQLEATKLDLMAEIRTLNHEAEFRAAHLDTSH